MRYRLLFGIACLAMVAAPPPVTAQGAAKPVLRQAQFDVTPAPQARTVTVTESITIDGTPMCAGFFVALAWYVAGEPAGLDPVLPGVSVSLAVFFVVSLRTRGPGEKALATFFPPPRPRVSPVPNER